jgi:YjbE family integral membrane protein
MIFLTALFRIVIIDLALSGDNAVVIGMAAHRLNPKDRKRAILIGGAGAIVLRIILTAVAAMLLRLTGLSLVGGILLLWIGFRMLAEEEESHEGVKVAASLREAVMTILIADFIMSADNVVSVAGASQGDLSLLLFGLVLSMAVLLFMGSVIAELLNKFWWLAYVGSGVVAWTGAVMIFGDPLTAEHLPPFGRLLEFAAKTAITLITLGSAHWFHRRRGQSSEN